MPPSTSTTLVNRKRFHPALPTRRRLLELAAVTGLGAFSLSRLRPSPAPRPPASLQSLAPELREMEASLAGRALGWLTAGQLVREDGWLYAIDVGLLAIYFAQAGDAGRFQTVRDFAVENLVVNTPDDPQLHRLVQWRIKPGSAERDATGTTETLRLAKALWIGAERYDRPGDADLAVQILHGYGRHEAVDQGVWLIRNYFSLNTRGYASNSFLVDYDPDFVRLVADARGDAYLRRIADNSYGVVRQAVTPCGLIYDLVQPELETLVPELDLAFFSPNDVCGLANCATVALTVTRGLAGIAGGVLDFAATRLTGLRKYYYGRTGEPVNDKAAASYEYATLVRLAAQLGATGTLATLAEKALLHWRLTARYATPQSAYTVSEILLAIRTALESVGGK